MSNQCIALEGKKEGKQIASSKYSRLYQLPLLPTIRFPYNNQSLRSTLISS